MDYLEFEGVIPEGEYGAGAVIVWDSGSYDNETSDDDGEMVAIEDAIDEGHVSISLHGEKLDGGYSLIRTGSADAGRWMLIKEDDDGADARRRPTSTEPESVISGRTIADVNEEESDGG